MERKFNFGVGEYYHLYNRGNDKRSIFIDDFDRERFLKSVFLLNSTGSIEMRHYGRQPSVSVFEPKHRGKTETLVDIGAYCLMPNHFHLLIREKIEGGTSRFMLKLMTSYSKYFNLRYKRTGSLFESRFKAKHADTDEYLHYLFAYIHLNPIKIATPSWPNASLTEINNAQDFLKNYRFSSYLDFIGEDRPEKTILNREVFPEYFQTPKDFGSFTSDWLRYQAEGEAYGRQPSVVDKVDSGLAE